MTLKRIVIIGGNGFLGSSLAKFFANKCEQIVIVSRRPVPTDGNITWQEWDGVNWGPWAKYLEGADAVINLAGKSVDCRYTKDNKREIYQSRILSTTAVGTAIKRCQHPPGVWLNASSATIYQASFDRLMTEANGEIGNDFSMDVCKQWEKTFTAFNLPQTRQIAMRISIVLGWEGAALPAMRNLVKLGLGGRQGDGRQYCSWIHVEDFCQAVAWFIETKTSKGAYNVTAPVPVTNEAFMGTLRKKLHVPFGLNSPRLLLEIGAFFLRTETELVLKSRKVYPKRLLDEGFTFTYQTCEQALDNLISRSTTKH